jgi:hypothetical protein
LVPQGALFTKWKYDGGFMYERPNPNPNGDAFSEEHISARDVGISWKLRSFQMKLIAHIIIAKLHRDEGSEWGNWPNAYL